jgi:hypothetical protein
MNMNPPRIIIDISNMKYIALNKSGHYLSDILKALKEANDTSHIPNSYIPSILKYLLTKSSFMDYSKIITSLILNYIKFNYEIIRPALNIKRERLYDFKRNKLKYITKD